MAALVWMSGRSSPIRTSCQLRGIWQQQDKVGPPHNCLLWVCPFRLVALDDVFCWISGESARHSVQRFCSFDGTAINVEFGARLFFTAECVFHKTCERCFDRLIGPLVSSRVRLCRESPATCFWTQYFPDATCVSDPMGRCFLTTQLRLHVSVWLHTRQRFTGRGES